MKIKIFVLILKKKKNFKSRELVDIQNESLLAYDQKYRTDRELDLMKEYLEKQNIYNNLKYCELESSAKKSAATNKLSKYQNQQIMEKYYKNLPVQTFDYKNMITGYSKDELDKFIDDSKLMPLTTSEKQLFLEKSKDLRLKKYQMNERNKPELNVDMEFHNELNSQVNEQKLYLLSQIEQNKDYDYYLKLHDVINNLEDFD